MGGAGGGVREGAHAVLHGVGPVSFDLGPGRNTACYVVVRHPQPAVMGRRGIGGRLSALNTGGRFTWPGYVSNL